jgi:hypothetical protein
MRPFYFLLISPYQTRPIIQGSGQYVAVGSSSDEAEEERLATPK